MWSGGISGALDTSVSIIILREDGTEIKTPFKNMNLIDFIMYSTLVRADM